MKTTFVISLLSCVLAMGFMADNAYAEIKFSSISLGGLWSKSSSDRMNSNGAKGPGVTIQMKLEVTPFLRIGGEFSYTRYTLDAPWDDNIATWWPWSHYFEYIKGFDIVNSTVGHSTTWEMAENLYARDWIGFVDLVLPTSGSVKPYLTGGLGIYKWKRRAVLEFDSILGYSDPAQANTGIIETNDQSIFVDPWYQAYSIAVSVGAGVNFFVTERFSVQVLGRFHKFVSTPGIEDKNNRHPFEQFFNGNAGVSFHY